MKITWLMNNMLRLDEIKTVQEVTKNIWKKVEPRIENKINESEQVIII